MLLLCFIFVKIIVIIFQLLFIFARPYAEIPYDSKCIHSTSARRNSHFDSYFSRMQWNRTECCLHWNGLLNCFFLLVFQSSFKMLLNLTIWYTIFNTGLYIKKTTKCYRSIYRLNYTNGLNQFFKRKIWSPKMIHMKFVTHCIKPFITHLMSSNAVYLSLFLFIQTFKLHHYRNKSIVFFSHTHITLAHNIMLWG